MDSFTRRFVFKLYDFVLKFLAKEKSVKKTIKSNNGKLIEFGKLLIIIPLFFLDFYYQNILRIN